MNSGLPIAVAAKKLASTFSGQLLQPADVGYDDARKVHNGLVDKRPALIARSGGVADVVGAGSLREASALRSRFAAAATMWRAAPPSMAGS